MSEPLLNVMKIMLLAGLYLFFIRVLWTVFSQLRDPRSLAANRVAVAGATANVAAGSRTTARRHAPASADMSAPTAPASGGIATAVAFGQLVVIDPAILAGTAYAIGSQITLGRAPTNGIIIDDTYVSTVHARIFQTNSTYFIEDLASRNGSTLNGEPIVATTALVPGDRLQLGATTMEFS